MILMMDDRPTMVDSTIDLSVTVHLQQLCSKVLAKDW